MIDASTSTAATTFTTGPWFGRERFWKIQIGSVVTPGGAVKQGDDDLVERQAEGQERAGDQRAAHQRERSPGGTW